jgi:hypothetical protein
MENLPPENGLKRRFRYRKVTPDLFEFMRRLKSYELSYKQIGEICELDPASVQYHLNVRQHELAIARAKRHNQKLDAQKYYAERRVSARHRRWMREYLRERYHNDPEFRAKMLRANMGGRFAD